MRGSEPTASGTEFDEVAARLDDAGEYFDPFAELYDAPKDADEEELVPWTGDDVAFYRELAEDSDGPALEIGVGTGRIYLELLAGGIDVDGVDRSEEMLDRLRSKADSRGLEPDVWRANAATDAFDREYGFVYAPARVLNWIWRVEDLIATFRNVREHLRPDGRFAFNTFVPSFADGSGDADRTVHEATVDGDRYRIVTTSRLVDGVNRVKCLTREVYREGDLVSRRATPFGTISVREFEYLSRLAGFSDRTVYGGFEGDPLQSVDQEVVWIAEA